MAAMGRDRSLRRWPDTGTFPDGGRAHHDGVQRVSRGQGRKRDRRAPDPSDASAQGTSVSREPPIVSRPGPSAIGLICHVSGLRRLVAGAVGAGVSGPLGARIPHCPCVHLLRRPSQVVMIKSPFVKAGLGAAVAAVLVLSAGCRPATMIRPPQPPSTRRPPGPSGRRPRPSSNGRRRSSTGVPTSGARKGKNYDIGASPVALTVPARWPRWARRTRPSTCS